jgi:hypothetical protein
MSEDGTAPVPRACGSTRCRRRVFDAQLVKTRGVPVDLVLDVEPRTWEQGARLKITPMGGTKPTVIKLTASTIHKAFGPTLLYVEHSETCESDQRKRKASKKTGHA